MQEKRAFKEISMLSALFCVFVVFIHITSFPVEHLIKGSWQHFIFYISNKILTFVVPGFIFLSGFKLSYQYKDKKFCFPAFFKERVVKIFVPYLCWYVVYYVFFLLRDYITMKSPGGLVLSVLVGDLVSPFYFIPLIFQFYLLFGVIRWLFERVDHKLLLILAFFMNFVFLEKIFFRYDDRFFAAYFFYFVLGCYFGKRGRVFNSYKWIVGIIYVAVAALYLYFSYHAVVYASPFPHWRTAALLFSTASIFAMGLLANWLCSVMSQRAFHIVLKVDMASYSIFLSHCLMIYVCDILWQKTGISSVIGQTIFTASILIPVVFISCILFSQLKKKKRDVRLSQR